MAAAGGSMTQSTIAPPEHRDVASSMEMREDFPAPVVPQMDAPTTQTYQPAPRPSFSDRITSCLDEAAANGLGPSARAAYSRSCANQ